MADETKTASQINSIKFGKLTSQNLESFGLASVLAENSEVFHGTVFSTRHVGRVSDLLTAKLHEQGMDEMRLRAMILISVFEAYEAHCQLDDIHSDGSLKLPLTLECGLDAEKVGVSISFQVNDAEGFSVERLADRIHSGQIESVIDRLLVDLYRYSNRLIIRHFKLDKALKIEIISLLGIPEKIDEGFLSLKELPLIVSVPQLESPAIKTNYTELGDLNYPTLLKEEEALRSQKPKTDQDKVRIKGTTLNIKDEITKVGGDTATENTDEIVVKAQIEELQKKLFIVKGGKEEDYSPDKFVQVVTGKSPEELNQNTEIQDGGTIQSFVKKLWPFQRKKVVMAETPEQIPEVVQEVAVTSTQPEDPSAPIEEDKKAAGNVNVELTANVLLTELQSGKFDQTLQKAKKESTAVINELKSAKGKKWVENLMADLISEKSKILDYAKKINLAVRQKEVEFKNKEFRYQEELKRKEELIRQRSVSLARAKDQLAQSLVNIEKIKEASHVTSEDSHLKQKLLLNQRLLTSVKDENFQLLKRLEELKKQLSSSQMTAKTKGPTITEFAALQTKFDRTSRQLEEFKKTNQQLLEKLNDKKKPSGADMGQQEDLKQRLEAAMKLAASSQKQSEKLQLDLDEARHEQERLKVELVQLQKKSAA